MNIRQCIPADRALADAFLRTAMGDAPAAESSEPTDNFELQLSLIATEGDATRGVALCRMAPGTVTHELLVATEQADLVQPLIDKAVTKLHARGIHKCRVKVVRGAEPAVVWNQSRWAGTVPAEIPSGPTEQDLPTSQG